MVALVLLHHLFIGLHQRGPLDHVGKHAGVVVDVAGVEGVCAHGRLAQQFVVDRWVQLNCAGQLALQVAHCKVRSKGQKHVLTVLLQTLNRLLLLYDLFVEVLPLPVTDQQFIASIELNIRNKSAAKGTSRLSYTDGGL